MACLLFNVIVQGLVIDPVTSNFCNLCTFILKYHKLIERSQPCSVWICLMSFSAVLDHLDAGWMFLKGGIPFCFMRFLDPKVLLVSRALSPWLYPSHLLHLTSQHFIHPSSVYETTQTAQSSIFIWLSMFLLNLLITTNMLSNITLSYVKLKSWKLFIFGAAMYSLWKIHQ